MRGMPRTWFPRLARVGLALASLILVASCDEGRSPTVPPGGDARLLWSVPGMGPRVYGPYTDGERVYLTYPGDIDALDVRTGDLAWSFDGEMEGFVAPGFVVAGDRVVVSWRGVLHGLDASNGVEAWTNAEAPTAYTGDPATGYPTDALAADDGDGFYVATEEELARIDPASGELVWRIEPEGDGSIALAVHPGGVCLRRSPIVTVRCYERTDGALALDLGQVDIGPPGALRIVGSRLIVDASDAWIAFDLERDAESWRVDDLPSLGASARIGEVLYACEPTRGCAAVDTRDGALRWRASPSWPSAPASSESAVFLVDQDDPRGDVTVLDPASGEVVDAIRPGNESRFVYPPAWGGGILFAATFEELRAYAYP